MFPGLPAPEVSEYLSHEASASRYAEGTSFVIHRYNLMANTGTYLDAPRHRYPDGKDVVKLPLETMVDLPVVRLDVREHVKRGRKDVDASLIEPLDLNRCALLVWTGWDEKWNQPDYLDHCPYLTEDAAELLVKKEVALVGIDSWNVDDTQDGRRPVHTVLLRAEIPIIEHMCNLGQLPASGTRLHAAPLPIRGGSSMPVRVYAVCASQ